jgi:tetratricopeptide (TPR) repeat protein
MHAFSGDSFLGRPPLESVPMKSLYDLLGARPDDDAEALRRAFRKAVKAHHPDLHPGDPDAALRFRLIVAANAILRDAKRRATYDQLLQREHQQLRLKLEYQQLRSNLERQQLRSKSERQQTRSKRMRTTFAVAVVGALVSGYGLFAPMPTTAIVAIKKDKHAAAAVATAKKDRPAATVVVTIKNDNYAAAIIAAAKTDDNTPTAIAVAKADAVKVNMDDPAGSVETVGARLIEPANPTDRGEPRHRHDGAAVADGVIKPSAPATNGSNAEVIPDRELALGPLPNDANFYREQGIASYRGGDFPRAIANFDEAIRLGPDEAQAYNIRGNAWDEIGGFERALADYDEAIRIDPNNPAVFHDRAILWRRKGELDKALVDLDRAIRFSFADANIYCDRGLVWYEKGRHDRAIADFNQAIKIDPNFAAAYLNRGLILHRNSEFNVAFADEGKAIRVDPGILDVIRRTNLRH